MSNLRMYPPIAYSSTPPAEGAQPERKRLEKRAAPLERDHAEQRQEKHQVLALGEAVEHLVEEKESDEHHEEVIPDEPCDVVEVEHGHHRRERAAAVRRAEHGERRDHQHDGGEQQLQQQLRGAFADIDLPPLANEEVSGDQDEHGVADRPPGARDVEDQQPLVEMRFGESTDDDADIRLRHRPVHDDVVEHDHEHRDDAQQLHVRLPRALVRGGGGGGGGGWRGRGGGGWRGRGGLRGLRPGHVGRAVLGGVLRAGFIRLRCRPARLRRLAWVVWRAASATPCALGSNDSDVNGPSFFSGVRIRTIAREHPPS
nr:hypothetical protein [Pseudoscardovia radai]